MAKKDKTEAKVVEIKNRKASHEYFIGDTYEAGLVLRGTEIKSLRQGKAQIQDAFVRVDNNEAILYHAHISEYDFGNIHNHNPVAPRKLLLNKKEILKIKVQTDAGGCSVIPLKIYFKRGLAKILIAVCKGKKLYDKREDLKKNQAMKEARRELFERR